MSANAGSSGPGNAVGIDLYHKWLGIPPHEQPPNFYRLLGVAPFESDADVIANAADARMAHVKTFQTGAFSLVSQRLLNEIALAKISLLTPVKKAEYDRHLRLQIGSGICGAADGVSPAAESDVYPLADPWQISFAEPRAAMEAFPGADSLRTPAPSAILRKKHSSETYLYLGMVGATVGAVAVVLMLYYGGKQGENPLGEPTSGAIAARQTGIETIKRKPGNERHRTIEPSLSENKLFAAGRDAPLKQKASEVRGGTSHHPSKMSPTERTPPNRDEGFVMPGDGQSPFPSNPDATAEPDNAPMSRPDLIEMVKPSIVVIKTDKGLGSGFVVDDAGLIVTNHHVVAGADRAIAKFSNGVSLKIMGYVAADKGCDLAILRAKLEGNKKLKPLRLRSELPREGEQVMAFGAPRGYEFTPSDGMISGVRNGRSISEIWKKNTGGEVDIYLYEGLNPDATWIQTTTPISPGNSGGPLVSMDGAVVGVNAWTVPKAQNLNFAISATAIPLLLKRMAPDPMPLGLLPGGRSPATPPTPSLPGDEKEQKYVAPRIDIVLPSGAVLNEPMLDVPEKWQYKLFPENATTYMATWPNGDVRGIFTLDDAKLDGWAIALYESGDMQTLAFYKRAKLDGRMIQWRENGERLLFAERKHGNKHGLICLFQDDIPWLLQEWEKSKIQCEYLVKHAEGKFNLVPKPEMNVEETEEYANALSELALLEATLEKNEAQLKRDLADWYRKEFERIKRSRQSKLSSDKLHRQLNRIAELHDARQRGMMDKRRRIEARP